MEYQEFIKLKEFRSVHSGFDADVTNSILFDYQKVIVKWAIKRGKAAIFANTGLGKTGMQLTWASMVAEYTGKPVLVLAPLAVSIQTIEEGKKFGINVVSANGATNEPIQIINYEQIHKYSPEKYSGIVLDESSILKGLQGKRRKEITEFAKTIEFRLSCTATPSPNDFMELGTQAEFLGIMSQVEMLSMFFVNDMSDTGKWRLMKHGASKFFEWLATWSIFITSPYDLGFDGSSHELPELVFHNHVIKTNPSEGVLFVEPAMGLQERNKARKESVDERVAKAAEIANSIDSEVLVWCNLNDESSKLTNSINGAIEVSGSDKPDHKSKTLIDFSHGDVKCLVSKPKIAGFGMNWQNCNNMVFVGLSDSFEMFYQAVRRCWRYGQTKPVHVHIISADTEGAVVENIRRKQMQHNELSAKMLTHMKTVMDKEIFSAGTEKTEYNPTIEMEIPEWLK